MQGGCDEAGVEGWCYRNRGHKNNAIIQHMIITSSKLTESRLEGGGAQLEQRWSLPVNGWRMEVLKFSEQAEFIRTVFAHLNVHMG
jgi:hypothetical protein